MFCPIFNSHRLNLTAGRPIRMYVRVEFDDASLYKKKTGEYTCIFLFIGYNGDKMSIDAGKKSYQQ